MKHLLTIICIMAGAATFAASPAATQEWVARFTATNKARVVSYSIATNTGYMTSTITNEDRRVFVVSHEMGDKLALCATNCTAASVALGVTNGTLFAYNGATQFVNAVVGQTIYSPTNTYMTFRGVASVRTNGLDRIDGYFDFYGGRITRSTAATLLGE